MTCRLFVTIDLDWASEVVIEETLNWFSKYKIPVTVFATHDSRAIIERMNTIEVGLHPYFSPNSSQGSNSEEIIENLSQIPTNIPSILPTIDTNTLIINMEYHHKYLF